MLCECINTLKISHTTPFMFKKGELYEFEKTNNPSCFRLFKDVDMMEVKTLSIDNSTECSWGFYDHKNSLVYKFKNYFKVI